MKMDRHGIWMDKRAYDAMKEWQERTERIAFGWATEEDLKWKEEQDRKHVEQEKRRMSLDIYQGSEAKGKCPVDGRMDRPVFIITNNKRTLAITDGMGHAYKIYGDSYMGTECKCLPENRYNPSEYEFDRGLSGMDF